MKYIKVMKHNPRVLVVATSRKTRGGITSVVKAHETGEQWKKFHCRWIQTNRDSPVWRKLWYLVTALIEYKADFVLVLSEQWRRWIKDSLGLTKHIEVLYNHCTIVEKSTILTKE